jgi:hypothetical protein
MSHALSSAVFPFLALACTAVAQGACLDQSYLPSPLTNGLEVTANQPVTQTFTVGMTGQLVQVEVSRIRHHNGTSSNPLQIAIVTTDASGTPTTTTLASATVQPSGVPASIGAVLVDISAFNVMVQAGQVLGLALTSPNAPGTPSYGWWGEAPGSAYGRGQVFIQQTIGLSVWDLAFQTWVSVPASWTNYGSGHPGTNGVPSLTSSANPVIGTTPNLLLGNSANAPTLGGLLFGLSIANAPTPWGGTALVQPLASVTVVLPQAGAPLPFPIPSDPMLCGIAVYAQGVVFDPGATHGIAFTSGLAFSIGS